MLTLSAAVQWHVYSVNVTIEICPSHYICCSLTRILHVYSVFSVVHWFVGWVFFINISYNSIIIYLILCCIVITIIIVMIIMIMIMIISEIRVMISRVPVLEVSVIKVQKTIFKLVYYYLACLLLLTYHLYVNCPFHTIKSDRERCSFLRNVETAEIFSTERRRGSSFASVRIANVFRCASLC